MNRPVACSSVIIAHRAAVGCAGKRMKRSIFCGTRISAFIALPSLVRASCKRDGEAEIGNERERMRRIDRQRRQHREDVLQEVVLEPGAVAFFRLSASTSTMFAAFSSLAQFAPARLLVAREARHRLADARELLGRASARPGSWSVMPARTWPLRPATRTMKNSSRLLAEIDRKRSLSSSGWLRVLGLLQHAAIEMQPGQLPVDESLGARRQVGRGFGRRAAAPQPRAAADFCFQNNGLCAIRP